ncbi:MAG: ROK family protein [Thermoguttaceae bacterium]|jgi:glucokinase|nr:ROK family protein [Thermoguttaceae bacterium]
MKGNGSEWLYLGVDVGGTKVQASVVRESGEILARQRCQTPRNEEPEQELRAIESVIEDALAASKKKLRDVQAIGIAIPGVVAPRQGRIIVTPNMNLSGVRISKHLRRRFGVPVAVGNDCNLGALGERWLGAARNAKSAFTILVGTGVGGGFVRKGKLWRGAREAASEIGHIVMQMGGPMCGCGNRGCLEALASRTAIERDLREAVNGGRSSMVTELTGGDLTVIRSRVLCKALEAGDSLVTEVMQRAAEVLGHACLTVRHLIDPEVIVLGGGVIEACGDFVVPIVRQIVEADRLPGAREGGRVVVSALGDDAVVLGAVALARATAGRNPFGKQACVAT